MSASTSLPPSQGLAEFASAAALGTTPAEVLDRVLALIALSARAATAAVPPPLAVVLEELESPPDCTVLSSGVKLGAPYAAYANAAAANAGAQTQLLGLAAVAVVPAGLAAAEVGERSGPDFVFGVAAGIETALRLSAGLEPAHSRRGFRLIGSAGRIGAAAGAARILGHDPVSTLAAIGFATTQAASPLAAAGGDVAGLLEGKAAADGIEAALLSGAGLIGPSAPIEGRRGLFALEAGSSVEAVTVDLGQRWLLADAEYPAIDESDPLLAAARALLEDSSVYGLIDAARA